MRKVPILLLLLAGCGGSGAGDAPGAVQTDRLTGLYTGPGGARLCLIAREGEARFGLVTPGCSGAGAADRRGNLLSLAMAGELPCTLDARVEGRRLAFPALPPDGCAYYCAPGATLAGLVLEKVGGTEADALSARDLVGDGLCG